MSRRQKNCRQGSPAQGKSCGECTLCCTLLLIESRPGFSTRLDTGEDLAKPAGIPCLYLGPQGCRIYQSRPLVCRQFICDWLCGTKELDHTPPPYISGFIGLRGNVINQD